MKRDTTSVCGGNLYHKEKKTGKPWKTETRFRIWGNYTEYEFSGNFSSGLPVLFHRSQLAADQVAHQRIKCQNTHRTKTSEICNKMEGSSRNNCENIKLENSQTKIRKINLGPWQKF